MPMSSGERDVPPRVSTAIWHAALKPISTLGCFTQFGSGTGYVHRHGVTAEP
jgi:hypothetical protein